VTSAGRRSPPIEWGPVEPTPLAARASAVVTADLREVGDHTVVWCRVEGGKRAGAIGPSEGEVLERAVRTAGRQGVPFVALVSSSGADVHEGVASLHAWGRVAAALQQVSGVVPTLVGVIGPCVSGPALLLGLVDQVVMTEDAFAYVSGPEAAASLTGVAVPRDELGGAGIHARRSGVAALVLEDERATIDTLALLLSYLPANHLADPPHARCTDPVDRDCVSAAEAVPASESASYDVRVVVADVVDEGSFLELRAAHAPNIVTGLGRLGGRPVGVVANQPGSRAGTLDIDASGKAARFVSWCDSFNIPIVTLVDTPGFEPGRDLEWRGMIRHGAKLVHAYGRATVPRCCVILRKAYGGAYIVMDSRPLGSDWCGAWPSAQIAVMGATGAVEILYRRRLEGLDPGERAAVRSEFEAEYARRFLNPNAAAARGLVDEVFDSRHTRRALVAALARLATKQDVPHEGRHDNRPL